MNMSALTTTVSNAATRPLSPATPGTKNPLDVLRNWANDTLGEASAVGNQVGKLAHAVDFTSDGAVYMGEEIATGKRSLFGKDLSLGLLHPEQSLDNQPVPQIDRPVVVVPGYTGKTSDYAPLVNHLTKDGANGGQPYYVKQGKFYTMDSANQLQPVQNPPAKGKVFEMVFSDIHQSPESNLPEVRENMDAISQATGDPTVDVVAHSMGGLDTRLYLDKGGSRVNHLMMVGTPNHGTVFGDKALQVVNDNSGWAESLGGLSQDDVGALSALRNEGDNPFLQGLNARWSGQRARVAAVQTEANAALPTATQVGPAAGDGLVPTSSVGLPGVTNKIHLDPVAHKDLTFGSTSIYSDMLSFFDWK